MKNFVKSGLVFVLVLAFGTVSLVDAADRKRDRKRDGSCLNSMFEESAHSLAANQKRTKDRKRDGSCLNSMFDESTQSLAAVQKRDRKRDGSCRV
jgi:hypothetical protein